MFYILTDNLKSAAISNDRHEPKLNKALEDMGNYYHFVVLPCDPKEPTQKALVEDGVRNTYNRVYAKLRKRNSFKASADEPSFCFEAPVPTDHANMRGSDYFK